MVHSIPCVRLCKTFAWSVDVGALRKAVAPHDGRLGRTRRPALPLGACVPPDSLCKASKRLAFCVLRLLLAAPPRSAYCGVSDRAGREGEQCARATASDAVPERGRAAKAVRVFVVYLQLQVLQAVEEGEPSAGP